MKILITGALNGNTETLKDLVCISEPDLVLSLGPLNIKSNFKLGKNWFFVRGKEDNIRMIPKCDGIDIMSRIFKTKTGLTFSGLSGVYHPQAEKLTRSEWVKSKGRLNRKSVNYIFSDDIERLRLLFQRLDIKRIDILLFSFNPTQVFSSLISELKPRYVFFSSDSYIKWMQDDTNFIGLEPATSEKGRYILRV